MPLTLPALSDALNSGLPAGSYVAMLLEDYSESIGLDSSHVTVGSADIEVPGNTLVIGSAVVFSTSGTLYAPLQANRAYRVVAKGPGFKVQLSELVGGTPLVIAGVGVGNHTVSTLKPVEVVNAETIVAFDMSDLLRYEINNYPASGRPTVTVAGAIQGAAAQKKTLSFTVDNSAGTASIEFDYVALISGGSTTPSNVGGVCKAIVAASPSPAQVPAGEQRVVPIEILLGPC